MKYYKLINNVWQIVNVYNLEKSRQINLYDYNKEKDKMILIGKGLY
jgi:hypothetical protein